MTMQEYMDEQGMICRRNRYLMKILRSRIIWRRTTRPEKVGERTANCPVYETCDAHFIVTIRMARDAEDAAKKRFEEQKKKLIEAAQASERKAKDAEARVEELRRKLSTASKETAQFELMFRKVQEDFAELLKMVAAIEDGNAELGEKLRKAIAAVAEDVLRKVGRKT